MNINKYIYGTAGLFLLLSVSACNIDEGSDREDCGPAFCISDLAGTWDVTLLEVRSCTGGEVFNLLIPGIVPSMTIQSNGRFTLRVDLGEGTENITGLMYFEEGAYFTIQFDEDPEDDPTYFAEFFDGSVLELAGEDGSTEWDFNDDGIDECAWINLVLERD
ncbi:hypothetical protein SAMN06265375_1044 [Muriicola jejuensis]|uniref:Lipocalin-like domain-containing protein n=1 Tax=Muriicola jejuensis TaxID=504488 RepID=A0A6P0UGM8_9FLAO|nr:hypothetical protein [Muriicola jejuensis]NER11019.1 hypothetical protein [Muriicola jejuensis]SMP22876.1 hypothetical protein SAMN06265375_1044 [Muriicola jejuensis]